MSKPLIGTVAQTIGLLIAISGIALSGISSGVGQHETALAWDTQAKDDKEVATVDQYGDPLPDGAVARLGTVRWRHGGSISLLAFSPDGKTIAYGGGNLSESVDYAIRLCDAKTGKELKVFAAQPQGAPKCMAFSPDGAVLAIGTNSGVVAGSHVGVTTWDVATGKELRRFSSTSKSGSCVAFSPSGKILVAGDAGGGIRVWEPRSGRLIHEVQGGGYSIAAMAFSPDGRTLAAIETDNKADASILLWETASWKLRKRLPVGARGRTFALAYSPEGRILAASSLNDVDFWDTSTYQSPGSLELSADTPLGVRPALCGVSFSPDGKILAVAGDHPTAGLTLWSVESRKLIRTVEGHNVLRATTNSYGVRVVQSVAFGPVQAGQTPVLASGGADGTVRLWDPQTGKQLNGDEAHTAPIENLAFRTDGQLVTVSCAERTFRTWDTAKGKVLKARTFVERLVINVALSPSGKLLAASEPGEGVPNAPTGTVHLMDVDSGKSTQSLDDEWMVPLAFTANSEILLAGGDKPHSLWAASTGKLIRKVEVEDTYHIALTMWGWPGAVNHDASLFAMLRSSKPAGITEPSRLVMVDLATGKTKWSSSILNDGLHAAAFSPDGKLLATAWNRDVLLYEAETGKLVRTLNHQEPGDPISAFGYLPNRLAFSPDGKTLIAGNRGRWVFIWDVATGKELRRFQAHRGCVLCVRVAPDGKTFATSSDDCTAVVWNMPR